MSLCALPPPRRMLSSSPISIELHQIQALILSQFTNRLVMDFQTFNRRELQALCKLNKIPANITSIAMVDALKSLQTVEGIEEFLNPSRTETVGLSIESPERIEVTSPRVPRTCTQKKAKIELNEVMKTPLISCTRKKDPETSFCHDVASQLKDCEDIAKNKSLVDHEKKCIPNTPVVDATYIQMKVTKSTCKETVKKETANVQSAYSTRRSTRLAAKKFVGVPLQEKKHDVVVLDESDENSKIENTFESGKEKVDCCEEVDSLKVKLVEVFEQLEEKNGQVENLKSDLEGICNPNNHNVVEEMNAEGIEENICGNTVLVDFVNPKVSMSFEGEAEQESSVEVEEFLNPSRSETVGLSIESPERKKAKIAVNEQVLKTPLVSAPSSCHDVASQLIESEDIAKNKSLVAESTPQDTVSKETTRVMETEGRELVKIDEVKDLGSNPIQEKHDVTVLVLDGNSEIEKEVVNVDLEERHKFEFVDNQKTDSEVDFVSMDLEQVNEEGEAVEVTHESSVADVSFVEEENHQFSTNANHDVIGTTEVSDNSERQVGVVVNVIEADENNNEKEAVVNVDEKGPKKSLFDSNKKSLRQLKKQLKATLLNSPPPTSIRIKTEDSDNKDIKKPQLVVVEDNEKEGAKTLNNTCSLRQLRKQVKAISVKYNNID